ncbi:hypothetical protein F4553_005227 [Allocatelliglobosispora scoriae]|uniref:Uridine kinase n=1 Tax=Allocatelliglobosispora scoriae TaxID=643052 RepID=A0A841BWJ0_9ACTN|nr:uridine kinase [Allocatelliglobosispora scoriae]MBB5871848.1 hypothetical protein [Allocatelliglobosispora scoriae]
MRFRAVTMAGLVAELAERIVRRPGWCRVAIDGPPAAAPEEWSAALAEALRERGRAVLGVRSADFWRPRSVRYEQGRTNPDAFYEEWLDLSGLRREVLDPLAPGGTGRVLPTLWNPVTDRATRASYLELAPDGVLLLSGALLLGAGLPLDLAVHLVLSPAALARRTPSDEVWTLPAFARYADEVDPASVADVVVRVDDPKHPAALVSRLADS